MIIDPDSFLVVVIVAAFAPLIAALAGRLLPALIVPIVVVEIALGALIGPHGIKLARITPTLNFLATLGLGFLFFFAGYEIDFKKIRGAPLWLAVLGWGISLVIAYTFAGLLAAAGVVISGLLTGSAMSTTAIGTILPVMQDTNQLKGRFGPMMLAAGAIGELGPILIVTLVLSTQSDTGSQALLLAAFVVLTIVAAVASHATFDRAWPFLDRTMDTSGQVPIRLTVLLVFALVVIASKLGLDIILGAFAAGMIVRMLLEGRDPHRFESKIDAVGFGFLIPFFFIQSGMNLDLAALGGSIQAVLKVPLFLLGFLVVRGMPALLLYRRTLDSAERKALALFSATELPLVVAITSLGVQQGHMRPSTAVALVTAAVLSVLIFPSLAISIRRHDKPEPAGPAAPELTVDPATG
jgi:Kef-type K+ transport system membrane component KefB